MKKSYLLLCLLTAAGFAFAQNNKPKTIEDLLQHPSQLTPELASAIVAQGVDEDGVLPPSPLGGYNLADSTYYFVWNGNDWSLSYKYLYTNDCNLGKHLSSIQQIDPDFNGSFVNDYKEEYQYYANGNWKEFNYFTWVPSQNNWLQTGANFLNAAGNTTERWGKSDFDDDGVFDAGSRSIYYYNGQNNITQAADYDFNPMINDWTGNRNTVYSYNNGLLESVQVELFDLSTATWQPSSRTFYYYDAEGKETYWLRETNSSGTWVNASKRTLTYNANDQLIGSLLESYQGNAWVNTERIDYTYYPNGETQATQTYEWVGSLQDWVETIRNEYNDQGYSVYIEYKYAYDPGFGGYTFGYNLATGYTADWKTSKIILETLVPYTVEEWVSYDSVLYNYNVDGRLETRVSHRWDEDFGIFQFAQLDEYFNTGCFFNATHQVESLSQLCSFANPLQSGQAIECLNLDASKDYTLDLFTMTGARVHSQSFQSGQSLTTPDLAPGIYLMAIHDGQGMLQRNKVVVGR